MPDPNDLLRPWQEAIRQVRGATAPLTGASEEALRRVIAPVTVLSEVLDQSAAAMRTQAQAFDAASQAFRQVSDLMQVQANLIEQAARSLRDPTHALRAAGGAVAGGTRRARGSSGGTPRE